MDNKFINIDNLKYYNDKIDQIKQDTLVSGQNIKTINGESIVGSGDIVIESSGGSGAYFEVNHGTSDTTFILTPNTFHVWDEVASLTLDFGSETSGVANEFLFQFTSGSTATSLTLPDDIKWANDEAPTIAENMIYQVSVLKGLASVLEFKVGFNINNYLTMEALEDGLTASLSVNACEYCIDGDSNWKTLSAGTATETINTGQTLSFRGELTPDSSNGIGTFTINKTCNLKGNCMSMLFGDNAADNFSLSGKDRAFYKLFDKCTTIVSVSPNFLPATTLIDNCYSIMFRGCTGLTAAPELPATTLASNCYGGMFYGCTGLIDAPVLPATTLASNCYDSMFYGCTGLTDAPVLPATTLADKCYQFMFRGCTGLTDAPVLPATTLASNCYDNMFRSTGLTAAPELPATTLASNCYKSMFYSCTGLTVAPELPATTLADYCYRSMFYGCTGLTVAPELPATTLASNCYYSMFSGCTGLTVAPELPATTLADYCYSGMFYGCIGLTVAPELPATTLASNCYDSMFYDCTGLTDAPELPATTLADYCYSGMFYGCTGLTVAPELPATTLADNCYEYMFSGCTSLNYIKMLATNISAASCLDSWVGSVASNGTFVKNAAMTSLPTGSSGIPNGWTVQNA